LAIVFGIVGLKGNNRGLATAGLICAIAGAVISILVIVFVVVGMSQTPVR